MNSTEATTNIVSEMPTIENEEQMTIEADKMCLVAGRKFSNKERLEKMYGVRVNVPAKGAGSQVVIKGPADMVSAAKRDIEESVSFETNFFIGKEFVRLIIGPKGERIESLRKEKNVKINNSAQGEIKLCGKKIGCEAAKEAIESIIKNASIVSFFVEKGYLGVIIGRKGDYRLGLEKAHNVGIDLNQEDGKIVIVGKKSDCEACKKTIESMIEKKKAEHLEKFYVPAHLLGFVVGWNFSKVKRIESAYNVQVSLPSAKNGVQEIWVKGKSAEDVSCAKKDIMDNLPWKLVLAVDKNCYGSIIGRGGENVQRLRREYGVKIDLKGGYAIIDGRKSRAEAAGEAIDTILSTQHKDGDAAANAE